MSSATSRAERCVGFDTEQLVHERGSPRPRANLSQDVHRITWCSSRLSPSGFTEMKACKQIWEDLPWFLKPVRYMSQLVAYGTDCPCCLGFRVWVGLALGIIIGYSLG